MARITLKNPNLVIEQSIPFTYTSGTVTLQSVSSEVIIDSAWVEIDVPFDDSSATVTFGTVGSPGLILGGNDVSPTFSNQYANLEVTEISAADTLALTIEPRSSTQGTGLLVYRIRG